MRYIVTIGDKSYEVEVERGQANVVGLDQAQAPATDAPQTSVPDQATAFSVKEQAPVETGTAPIAQATPVNEGEPVKAPMPGTVIGLRVETGQLVKKGDVLLVLEAMKMENELFAPSSGSVRLVVEKDASVSTGDILAWIQ